MLIIVGIIVLLKCNSLLLLDDIIIFDECWARALAAVASATRDARHPFEELVDLHLDQPEHYDPNDKVRY